MKIAAMLRVMKACMFLILLLFAVQAQGEEVNLSAQKAMFAFTFESLSLKEFNHEKMGLLGGNLLFPLDAMPWLSLGAAAYGSVVGERGGFITLGLASDASYEIYQGFSAHAGLFVGAGGGHGGYQLQGGGLMLREHLGLNWQTQAGDLGFGLSRIDFPNGHVASSQAYMSYTHHFQSLIGDNWLEIPQGATHAWGSKNENQFSLTYQTYDVPQGVKTSSGGVQHPGLGLVGIEWQQTLNTATFLSMAAAGAMQGRSNGYMQILLGAGIYQDISDNFRLKALLAAGVAGGGNIDTGGGLLTKVAVGAQAMFTNNMALELEVGWVDSVIAGFKAKNYGLNIHHTFYSPKVGHHDSVPLSALGAYEAKHMRVRMVHQTYMELPKANMVWRVHHANRNVNLLGFQNDYFLTDDWFVTGQGIAAYEGQAGGYMTGLLGLGGRYPLTQSWVVEGEVLVGAAGGGGLAVGGGLVWQVNAGLSYAVSRDNDILLQLGRMDAPKGGFAAHVFSVSIAHKFSLFMQ